MCWVISAEIFPEHIRGNAGSIAICVGWIFNIVIGFGYPIIADAFGNYGFVVFIVFLAFFITFFYFFLPETSHKTVEEIMLDFMPKKVKCSENTFVREA